MLNKFEISKHISIILLFKKNPWPCILNRILHLIGCTQLILHHLYLEPCALIEQTKIMHFFGLVMYNGDGIKFSFKLNWFKILCANDWSKRFV
jgi:hypothetical protein